MAVVIRLSRRGEPKRPIYRVIASPKGSKRDSKFLEILGIYNPMTNPPEARLKEDRVRHWISVGATASETVQTIIKMNIPGLLEARTDNQTKKIQAARKARKARLAKAGKPAKKSASKAAAKK